MRHSLARVLTGGVAAIAAGVLPPLLSPPPAVAEG
ncbi:hypothetical protein GA0115259_108041, partial [Streptomyces sp. MnatMP-M17]